MATDFKSLLQNLSSRMSPQEAGVLVGTRQLPGNLKDQPAAVVLDSLVGGGDLSLYNLDLVMDAMKEIGRNDLYKQVKLFKRNSGKKLPDSQCNGSPEKSYLNFDIAENQAVELRNTLKNMEGSEAISVYRIEEVYTEAKEAAENLLRLIHRANCLSRMLRPSSRTASEQFSSPPSSTALTSSTECPDVPDPSPPVTTGFKENSSFRERITKKLALKKPKSKKERTPSPKGPRLNRSQSEKVGHVTPKNPISARPRVATTNSATTNQEEDDSAGSDYDLPDFQPPRNDPNAPKFTQTLPRQVPQSKWQPPTTTSGINNSSSPRDSFAPPHQRNQSSQGTVMPHRPAVVASAHKLPSDSESDSEEYDDISMFMMQNPSDKKSGSFNGKPESLLMDGSSSRGGRYEQQSSTCSTPSSETMTPPATLPKPFSKRTNVTPSIPISRQNKDTFRPSRQNSQNSIQSGSGSVQSRSGPITTPNQPMVDIQQQYPEAFRQKKHMYGSPQGGPSSVGSSVGRMMVSPPHPVSLAKALEMSTQGTDCNDSCSCTGDSGFDEYTPLSTSWHKTAATVVQAKRKSQSLKPDPEPQQNYANISIISAPQQQHTDVSKLTPIYNTHLSQTPSPPTDHTTISAVGPMYTSISIEEQEADEDECREYMNVQQFVEPAV